MSKKLFVGGIPYSSTKEELEELFAPFGAVETVSIVTDRETQQPRGFAFVEMADDADINEVVKQLDGSEFGGRKLTVNEARPRENRPSNGGGYQGNRGGYNN